MGPKEAETHRRIIHGEGGGLRIVLRPPPKVLLLFEAQALKVEYKLNNRLALRGEDFLFGYILLGVSSKSVATAS